MPLLQVKRWRGYNKRKVSAFMKLRMVECCYEIFHRTKIAPNELRLAYLARGIMVRVKYPNDGFDCIPPTGSISYREL
jgi:hypothetical protein